MLLVMSSSRYVEIQDVCFKKNPRLQIFIGNSLTIQFDSFGAINGFIYLWCI
jgi:hypothetical protein